MNLFRNGGNFEASDRKLRENVLSRGNWDYVAMCKGIRTQHKVIDSARSETVEYKFNIVE